MNLMHLADESILNALDPATQSVFRTALVAHLRDEFFLAREVTQIARFINRLRQRLLTINMLA